MYFDRDLLKLEWELIDLDSTVQIVRLCQMHYGFMKIGLLPQEKMDKRMLKVFLIWCLNLKV